MIRQLRLSNLRLQYSNLLLVPKVELKHSRNLTVSKYTFTQLVSMCRFPAIGTAKLQLYQMETRKRSVLGTQEQTALNLAERIP